MAVAGLLLGYLFVLPAILASIAFLLVPLMIND
jgi:hypothetical protein